MPKVKEGFVNHDKCINCGLCEKVCPVLNNTPVNNEPKAYACINKDEKIRMDSSSGGTFTLIAEQVINSGGVVFGAGFDEDFTVVHSYAESRESLSNFHGSKYVQSKIGDMYKQAEKFLKQRRQVLFTGTPCQIAGLKSYLRKLYDNLLCVDFICFGVPSTKVWKKYISYHENNIGAPVRRVSFRNKKQGWKRFSMFLSFDNGMKHIESFDKDFFMQAFLKKICLRPSCHACNFKTLHRQSDITLADFWGVQNLLPEMDDDKGTSLVFINSHRGELIFEQIKDKLLYNMVDLNEAVRYNLSAVKSVKQHPNRENFFKELDLISFDALVKKYIQFNVSKIKEN
ncbi:Coenzyme F420 hydrogenase/dehydrogenase, beta subunit C-terminal domain [Thermosediminibacter oceani]|uniref:Coenzyme F420 hydrogenase/dehydrogenase beta subunit domain protein n=1 Tax=Thermosediminibacter oceani (strain ATCC BAA-1034 / DSM 16646 / JW/IW-1228P) TaxID=555079 RepID=D9S087_THEOJ|nr:Coenzyme F420 hydrogenase/dehydrogenase, beta subunit C-terminal domain [Thermosediminibacter oceani]ADL07015.1 coenzyme F420 hydrogenase/dehydrogenase beta subunit domain protein [Thermosediminibacter oceani DSM 16646]